MQYTIGAWLDDSLSAGRAHHPENQPRVPGARRCRRLGRGRESKRYSSDTAKARTYLCIQVLCYLAAVY